MPPRVLPLLLFAASACAPPDVDQETRLLTGTTIVSLTFDDTLADQYQVGAMLANRGLVGTFYVNSPRLTSAGYLTLDQVRTLQAAGNEIGGHTLDHVDLTTLGQDDMTREVCDDRNALLAFGFAVTSFAYPFAADNDTVHTVVANCNYNSARDGGGLLSASCTDCQAANPIPPPDPYVIRTNSSVQSTDTLQTLQGFVTHAEQAGGGWVPITFHHICDGCSSNGISPALLTQFLDWLAARKSLGTEVATVNQVIGGVVKPPVGSPPPPPDPTGNLLQNPSLETDINRDEVPDCWYRGGSGTNSATYTLVANASDGSVAQRIDMTSFTSGARRLVVRQDFGGCAPAAKAGHTYTMRASYIATTQPIFSVYYRDTTGTWKWLSQSGRLPTSTSYVTAQYTTPALPADAAAISIGLAITNVGYIIMDDYSLLDDQAQPPPPPTTNMLPNPSLETDANLDQVPDCWYRGGSGTNSATFTLVSTAADGNVAQRIDMTSFTSGARRLVTKQDNGVCAPAVTPGHTYTMRAAYMSNVQPIVSVYYRDTAGTWKWWTQSPRLPTSSTYATAQFTTPPLPSDATFISIGLAITNVGYIVMDSYSLEDAEP